MKTFTIAELEQFTLVKAHTFRAWEKRYHFLKSGRSASNRRLYTVEESDYILDFALLNRLGRKVSDLSLLDRDTIKKMAFALKGDTARQEYQINRLIIAMFSLRVEDFEAVLNSTVAEWGIEHTVEDVILPFLERLQIFCYRDRRTCEYHFIVTALRKKLITAIEQVKPMVHTDKSALLFLPEGEHFDLLLLYLDYQLRKSGFTVLYLGTDISFNNLQTVISRKQPHYVVTYISPANKKSVLKYASCLPGEELTSFFATTAILTENDESIAEELKLISYKELLGQMSLVTSS